MSGLGPLGCIALTNMSCYNPFGGPCMYFPATWNPRVTSGTEDLLPAHLLRYIQDSDKTSAVIITKMVLNVEACLRYVYRAIDRNINVGPQYG